MQKLTRLNMKYLFFLIPLLFSNNYVFADDAFVHSPQEITKQIIKTVKNYANSISCPYVEIEPKLIAALKPYKSSDQDNGGKYAVIWTGDLGCLGGSGSEIPHIAVVSISTGAYVVDPQLSSPNVKFEIPARNVLRVVSNTSDSLLLEGIKYGDDDALCCPSAPIHFTVNVDKDGNWKSISEQAMPPKKADLLLKK
jgi:hypothetical protein